MRLDRIKVKGFKSIKEMDLQLSSLNVLIGANGAGKSNFISVFKLLNQIVEKNLQVFIGRSGGANTFLYFGPKVTKEIKIRLDFGRNGYQADLIPSFNDNFIFANEVCWYHEEKYPQPYQINLGGGHKETLLIEESQKSRGRIATHVLDSLKSWKIYHFHDTSETASIKQLVNINDNAVLKSDASNLPAFLYKLKRNNNDYYNTIVATLRLVAPFFNDFILRPSPLSPGKIQLEWSERNSDNYFNAHSLSDGTLRFICLTTLLLQPVLPTTILIDEPELGLHPYAITLLANLLESAATKTQVIVSTQSVPLVNQFNPENIIVVDREGDQSIFKKLDAQNMDNWLEDYGLGDLWEKNVIGGRPR